ncbi:MULTISPECIES: DNA repair protein RadC [unclassified Iodidimonas]|jgi:DNA repair protein RadC|uniref:RadC family protein n=1 Tax=unclassified Iodidimonas TaxID=2626145 RepID=UPI002482DEA2|nr:MULTISPECIES: DNA repair protein RadC [unclassified Iodidimonas]
MPGDPSDNTGHRQRLRTRFMATRGQGMPDYEMIELLLMGAILRRDVKPLAKQMLKLFGSYEGVITASPERLREVDGVGEVAISMIKLVEATALRLSQSKVLNRPILSNWRALLDYCTAAMAHAKTEQFRILFLDRKNILMADEVQQQGTIDHTPVYPREVIKRALELHASALILVHNHPSGDPTPSRGDIEMTKDIVEAAKKLGISVHDHLVIGRKGHVSFKSLGLL